MNKPDLDAALAAGAQHAAAGQFDQAAAAFGAAVECDDHSVTAFYNLGVAQRKLGRISEAIASFERTIALAPTYAEAHYNLANALATNSQPADAAAAYEAAIALRPSYVKALRNLVRLHQRQQQYSLAIDAIERLLAATPHGGLLPQRRERMLARGWTPTADHLPQHQVGKWTYGRPDVASWGEGSRLTIGAFSSIASGVTILLGGEHRTDCVTTYPFDAVWTAPDEELVPALTKGNVVIGNDVWLGTRASILSGVTIGDGAVVGAWSVVAKDVPPYAIVCGNPARVVRMRFDDDTIAKLLQLAWWNWDDTRIEAFLPLLLAGDVPAVCDALLKHFSAVRS